MYPTVIGEVETIHKINEGYSIARFGDGELGVSTGRGYTRESYKPALSAELTYILSTPNDCLIGIPTMDKRGNKYENWKRHKQRYSQLIPHNRTYYSSLISRPDCGEWMQTEEYARLLQSLWLDKGRITVVASEPGRNKLVKIIESTNSITYIECPWRDAYSEIERLEAAILAAGNPIAILSHGVSATCLAYRLSPHLQAIDMGSVGGFLAKMLNSQQVAA